MYTILISKWGNIARQDDGLSFDSEFETVLFTGLTSDQSLDWIIKGPMQNVETHMKINAFLMEYRHKVIDLNTLFSRYRELLIPTLEQLNPAKLNIPQI